MLKYEIHKALHASFKTADDSVLQWLSNTKTEGATCTVCYFDDCNMVYTVCVGDSKAVLARRPVPIELDADGSVNPLVLTVDHTVLQMSEVQRIESCGGQVINGRVNGILEVTRTFGDPQFKKCGVICAPSLENMSFFLFLFG